MNDKQGKGSLKCLFPLSPAACPTTKVNFVYIRVLLIRSEQKYIMFPSISLGKWNSSQGIMLPGSPVCKTFHSVFVLFHLPDSSIHRKQRELGALSFRNIWDIGKQIFNSGIKMKGNKTLFVCFSHKRIWCTTEYGFRAPPIEESYAYEVIPNSSVWLTIQQLWNHSTGSVTIQKPWTHILAENGLLKTTWNYYSKIEGCSRLGVGGVLIRFLQVLTFGI